MYVFRIHEVLYADLNESGMYFVLYFSKLSSLTLTVLVTTINALRHFETG